MTAAMLDRPPTPAPAEGRASAQADLDAWEAALAASPSRRPRP